MGCLKRKYLRPKIRCTISIGSSDITFPGADDGGEDAAAPADDAAAPADDAAAPADGEGAEGGEMSPVQGLTMTLMTIDARIKDLYSQILTELDEAKRTKDSEELLMLKVRYCENSQN